MPNNKIWPYYDLSLRLEGLPPFEELTCLDLGCGTYDSVVAAQVIDLPWKELEAFDGYEPYLVTARTKEIKAQKHAIKQGDVFDVVRHMASIGQTFDVVLCFDVMEHLEKQKGLEMAELLGQIATKRIVFFMPMEPDDFHRSWDLDDNKLQEHISQWKPQDLKSLKFNVEEINDVHSETDKDGRRISFGAMWAIKNIG